MFNRGKAKAKGKDSLDVSPDTRNNVKLIIGSSLILFSLYLMVSILSIFFLGRDDISLADIDMISLYQLKTYPVLNLGGKWGLSLSNFIVNGLFGYSSILIPLILLVFGIRTILNKKFFQNRVRLISILMIWFSILLGYITRPFIFGKLILPGGSFGLYVSGTLQAVIGDIGVISLLLLSLSIIAITFKNNIGTSLLNFIKDRSTTEKSEEKEEVEEAESSNLKPKPIKVKERKHIIPEEPIEIVDNNLEIKIKPTVSETVKKKFDEPINDLDIEEEQEFDNQTESDSMEIPQSIEFNIDEPKLKAEDTDGPSFTIDTVKESEDKIESIDHNSQGDYDPTLDIKGFKYPPLDLLREFKDTGDQVSITELEENKNTIVEKLLDYKIEIKSIKATPGPTVTLYEIVPAAGIRISKIKVLEDDIAMSLAALGIRIIAPIPGKGTIGIEVPNKNPKSVSMKEILSTKSFSESKFALPLALGKTISNDTFIVDLAKMPHLLVAGATGQGKSVGLNAIITSLLYKLHPSQLKFVFVDPKMVELSLYSVIEKHYLAKMDGEVPIITDVSKVKNTLESLCIEMDQRYELLTKARVRGVKEYNDKFVSRALNPENGHKYMPYIVIVVDEFADLIMTAGKEIEMPIARIAQKARAVGLHMILATQRPSSQIITGIIKANFPAKIAFRVSQPLESRIILDTNGANQLVGKGDMLVATGNDVTRVQCAFIDTPEVEAITEYIGNQRGYSDAYILPEYSADEEDVPVVNMKKRDQMFEEIARDVVLNGEGSISQIQSQHEVGFNRARRIMDQLYSAGIVGPKNGAKPREVMIQSIEELERFLETLP